MSDTKSYWMWNWGEYEIYHTMLVHFRREERGFYRPAVWEVPTPYPTAQFVREIECAKDGYIKCYINGKGSVVIDGKFYGSENVLKITKGSHLIKVQVINHVGLPAVFIDSDVCPSGEGWLCNHFAGDFTKVGFLPYFDSVDKNPECFPFEYKTISPISCEKVNNGVLYDFGKEIFGSLNISEANENSTLGVFYGESREEALDIDFTYVTEYISGQKSYRLKQRAFRYVYIENAGSDLYVSADFECLPLTKHGQFEFDNALFNEIASIACYTFHLNCREGFFDGIKRDRWIWSGDAYQSARINRYLFADKEIEQRTLLGLVGKPPTTQHVNTILDYSLLWIIMLKEHYETYGDKDFLSRIFPSAKRLLDFCETRINKDGFIEGKDDDWTFIDWSDIDKTGAVCAEQMLLVQSYSSMVFMSKELGFDQYVSYETKRDTLKRRINEYYWNVEKGAFIDSFQSGKNNVTRHSNIFAVMYDIATKEQAESILKNVLKNDSITKITTPYFEGYELDVLAKLGEFEAVERMLTSYWGGMINLGASTIWEEYVPKMSGVEHYAMYGGKYEKSLCHAWGAGPIYLFGRYYLGVHATSVGYKTFTVQPQLGGLKSIKGTVPINGGIVSVELNDYRLCVIATKNGGTVIFKGKSYSLCKNQPLVVEF